MDKLIEWKDAYNVGVCRIDYAHIELFDLANRVLGAIRDRLPEGAVNEAFTDLLFRTVTHFDQEESLLEATFYPEMTRHRSLHDRLVRNLVRFQGKYKSGGVDAGAVSTFLLDWLLEHILQDDIYNAPYFRDRGI